MLLSFQPLAVEAAADAVAAAAADINYHHRIVCSGISSFDTSVRRSVRLSRRFLSAGDALELVIATLSVICKTT